MSPPHPAWGPPPTSGASGGILRSGAIPPSFFASVPSGPRAAAFSARIAVGGRRRAGFNHRGSAPML